MCPLLRSNCQCGDRMLLCLISVAVRWLPSNCGSKMELFSYMELTCHGAARCYAATTSAAEGSHQDLFPKAGVPRDFFLSPWSERS